MFFSAVDTFSGGICCWRGSGGYTLTLDGETIKTGGDFRASEIVKIGSYNSDTNEDMPANSPVEPPTDQYSCEPGFEVLSVKIEFENDPIRNSTVWAFLDGTSDTILLKGNSPLVSN